MKLVLQNEAAECGLASLAMVARHHGHKIDMSAMRQRFGTSLKGVRLRDLMKTAEQLMLGSRALRLEPFIILGHPSRQDHIMNPVRLEDRLKKFRTVS